MKYFPRVWWVMLLVVAGGTWAQAAPESGAEAESTAEVVSLVFAWPTGLQGSVSSTETRERAIGGQPTTHSAKGRYSFEVATEGDKLRVDFGNASLDFPDDGDPQMQSLQAAMTAQLAELMPSYLVSQSGDFVGLHDLAAFQQSVQAALDTAFQDFDPAAAQQVQQVRDMMTSEAFLVSKVMEEWNAIVGAWVGADLEVGAEYTYSAHEPVAAFPGQKILMNYTISIQGFESCQRGGEELRCVELEMRSIADPEETQRMIEGFLSTVVGDAMPKTPIFTSLEVENVIGVLTEPATLVPHTSYRTKTVRAVVSAEGQEEAVEQVDRTEAKYLYP